MNKKVILLMCLLFFKNTAQNIPVRPIGIVGAGIVLCIGGTYCACKNSQTIAHKLAHNLQATALILAGLSLIVLPYEIIKEVDGLLNS